MSRIWIAALVALFLGPSSFAAHEFSRCQTLLSDLMQWLQEATDGSAARSVERHEGGDTLSIRFGLSLRPGMELSVLPRAFELKGRRPIRMTVRKVKRVRVPRGPMYINALLESPRTGALWIPHFVLVRHVVSEGRLRRSTVFAPEEFVSVGRLDGKPRIFERFDGEGELGLPPEGLPLPGRFKGLDRDGTPVVEIQVRHPIDGLPPTLVRVPAADVQAAPSGTENRLSWHIRRLAWIRPEIAPGERVRYRTADGGVRAATFIRLLDNHRTVEIRTSGGRRKRLPRNRVFRLVGPEQPYTPRFAFDYLNAAFDNPRGTLRELLDGAAAIASHPDFAALSPRSRIFHLLRYVQLLVPWTQAGRHAEIAGLRTFNDIACAGVGVCRHSSTLLAVVFAEAGLRARLYELDPGGKNAHQWPEVDLPGAGAAPETWVADPTPVARGPEDVFTLGEAQSRVTEDPDSWSARYYANPARRLVRELR